MDTITPIIQFLLHINDHYDIFLTWEVHQVVYQCYLIICYDITTTGWLREYRFGLVTISCTILDHIEVLLLLM